MTVEVAPKAPPAHIAKKSNTANAANAANSPTKANSDDANAGAGFMSVLSGITDANDRDNTSGSDASANSSANSANSVTTQTPNADAANAVNATTAGNPDPANDAGALLAQSAQAASAYAPLQRPTASSTSSTSNTAGASSATAALGTASANAANNPLGSTAGTALGASQPAPQDANAAMANTATSGANGTNAMNGTSGADPSKTAGLGSDASLAAAASSDTGEPLSPEERLQAQAAALRAINAQRDNPDASAAGRIALDAGADSRLPSRARKANAADSTSALGASSATNSATNSMTNNGMNGGMNGAASSADQERLAAMDAFKDLRRLASAESSASALRESTASAQGERTGEPSTAAERSVFSAALLDAARGPANPEFGHGGAAAHSGYNAAGLPDVSAPAQAALPNDEPVKYWVSPDVQNAEMQLDGLGTQPVEVSISMHGNEAQVAFRSDELQARDALQNASNDLKDMLQREGLVLTGMSVGSSGSQGSNTSDQRPRQGPSRPAPLGITPDTPKQEALRSSYGNKGRSLDLFV